ncbi:RTC4-like domain-containing protein [Aspergillus unguis]
MPSLRARQSSPLHFKEDSSSDSLSPPPSDLSGEESPFESENDLQKTPRNKNNNKRKTKQSSASGKKRRDVKPAKAKKVETEEDIYALPLGTSDEEEDNDDEEDKEGQSDGLEDFTPKVRRNRESGLTLEEKLASKEEDEEKNEKSRSETETPRSNRKRKPQDMLGSDDTKDQMFSMWSQRSGKRQSQGYGSKFRKTPTSSFVDSHPPSSVPQPKSSATSVEPKETSEDEDHKGAVFRAPREIDADALLSDPEIAKSEDDDDSPLSSAISDDLLDIALENEGDTKEVKKDHYNPQDYLCPMCNEPVEPGLLLMFREQPRQRFREQQKFCKSHKQDYAEKEWQDKGYPKIDWDKFKQRLEGHLKDLEKLMIPHISSFYRNVLDTAIANDKGRTFKLSLNGDLLETISCGYYGTRGSEVMLETITTRYGRKLRRLATEDNVVKRAGVVGYTQAVLVPELAVSLIKEDMHVDDNSARQIMRDSITIGEKLNPALNDFVPRAEEDDDDFAN